LDKIGRETFKGRVSLPNQGKGFFSFILAESSGGKYYQAGNDNKEHEQRVEITRYVVLYKLHFFFTTRSLASLRFQVSRFKFQVKL
jgi:hypothetical protein